MRREPRITPTGPEHLAAVVAMHRRCSPHTLWSRYHRATADPASFLPALLSRPGSVHLAAWDPTGRIVAVGHLMPDGSAVEAALLVEDAWQDRGLGTRLLLRLGRHAAEGEWETAYGLVLPGDERIDAMLGHTALPVHHGDDGGVTTVWARTKDLVEALPPRRRLRLVRARTRR
ncbi:GNAT family N-acetyltransferase [Streptomyces fructofermentans]|uniref:GNAT family N-acetyltransferase n=1 Tax=Streptomyces fructofermentans TaxID=152141 RepID=UPI00379B4206